MLRGDGLLDARLGQGEEHFFVGHVAGKNDVVEKRVQSFVAAVKAEVRKIHNLSIAGREVIFLEFHGAAEPLTAGEAFHEVALSGGGGLPFGEEVRQCLVCIRLWIPFQGGRGRLRFG